MSKMPTEQTPATGSSSTNKSDNTNEENGALRVKLGDISLDSEQVNKSYCNTKYFFGLI